MVITNMDHLDRKVQGISGSDSAAINLKVIEFFDGEKIWWNFFVEVCHAHIDERVTINMILMDGDAPMEVRAVDTAGHSGLSKEAVNCYKFSGFCMDFWQMSVAGKDANSMVDDNRISTVKSIPGENDLSAVCGKDFCTNSGPKVSAEMWGVFVVIENSDGSIVTGDITF